MGALRTNHSGYVIGYDVRDKFLSSQDYSLIPVTAGDVVYTSTKSSPILNIDIMRGIRNISMPGLGELGRIQDPETLSLARKIFLTTHASWVYEEEVRVVKILDSIFQETAEFVKDGRRSYYELTCNEAPGRSAELVPGLSIFNFQFPASSLQSRGFT